MTNTVRKKCSASAKHTYKKMLRVNRPPFGLNRSILRVCSTFYVVVGLQLISSSLVFKSQDKNLAGNALFDKDQP